MKFHYLFCMLIIGMSYAHSPNADPFNELDMEEPELVVLLDQQIRDTCQELMNVWRTRGTTCEDEHIAQLLDPALLEIDYETVLLALHACLDPERNKNSREEQNLRTKLQRMYEALLDEYDQLVGQASTRRIKCKRFCVVSTRDLVVDNRACINNLIVKGGFRIGNLDGVLLADNGVITAGDLPINEIPDGSITTAKLANGSVTNAKLADGSVTSDKIADDTVENAKIADNAVTTDKIAPMAITLTETAFNPVVATTVEAKPLTIYRGSITGATGAITSGAGFTATRNGAGDYTISLTAQAYTSATTYQVFVQLLAEGDAVTITNTDGSNFNVNTTNDNNFSIFTIGA